MADILWLIRRLKAMSFLEIQWRLSQNLIQKKEKTYFEKKDIAVTSYVFNSQLSDAQLNSEKLHINFKNREYSLNTSIHLLAGALYDDYKKIWNAGFQTDHIWPDTFSYKLEYKQRDDIGDARTNWELNRHFQFALLAKDYAVSGDVKYLFEFKELFQDWTDKNPFLHGISWTSVMETAIRCSNWCYAYAFLEHGGAVDELLEKLRIGIINMTDYIANHYSRYSSANNHLIIEAYAIGQSGILFNRKEWTDTAIRLLTEELPKQNYTDGVNKELSLHYQSFYIEAMGLMMRLMIKNEIDVPASWEPMLQKMSQYLADCMGEYGETVAFGDDDEGKILDLQSGDINYYSYVLSLMSLLLHKRYVENSDFETLKWLFTKGEIQETEKIKKVEYMEKHIGEHFEGVISGMNANGLFIELVNTIEGMIPIWALYDDYYYYNEEKYEMVGEEKHKIYKLGQKLMVYVDSVNKTQRTITFLLAEEKKMEEDENGEGNNQASSEQ